MRQEPPDTMASMMEKVTPYLIRYSQQSCQERATRLVELLTEGPNGVGVMASDKREFLALLHDPAWSSRHAARQK